MKTVLLSIVLALVISGVSVAHPIHVSIVNMDYSPDSGKIDYSVRLFYDDFQALINFKYNTLLDFSHQSRMTTKEQEAVVDYIDRNFCIMDTTGKCVEPKFLGWKVEDASVWLFFCAYPVLELSFLTIKNTIMLELFADQVNLVILHTNNNQQGFQFDKRTTVLSSIL